MSKDISQAVREVLLSFPETEETVSHGSPTFKVRGRTFATYTINHHGDGRVALNLDAPPGAQQLYTEMEPEHYFIPPYTGPKGWLGVELDKGLTWKTIATRAREAYEKAAPPELAATIGETIEIEAPDRPFSPEEIDPFKGLRAQVVLAELARRAGALPETTEGLQFGNPVWKAGKKTFVSTHYYHRRMTLSFWVGAEAQLLLTQDPRFSISAYTGHNGWIDLDVEDTADWEEIQGLLLTSYRHFALKRMLKALPEE
jgi:predicted DNA-binding protein (MmcQ/YjbR family)